MICKQSSGKTKNQALLSFFSALGFSLCLKKLVENGLKQKKKLYICDHKYNNLKDKYRIVENLFYNGLIDADAGNGIVT
jgi:hypothetical protein